MKNPRSSLLLYIIYKYFFGYMIIIMILGTIKEFIHDGQFVIKNTQALAVIGIVLLVLQIITYRLVFRATINKEEINLNGHTIRWDNVKSIKRLYHIYILKTKDKNRYYLFPTEKQSYSLFAQRIEDTDMDQIINLRTAS